MKKSSLVAGLCLALALPASAWAQTVTLTFDEAPTAGGAPVSVTNPVPAAGASPFLSFSGVTFDFRVAGQLSPDARYNAPGPGNFTHIRGQVLEGDAAGVLALSFAAPTSTLAFGLALSGAESLTPGFDVTLLGTESQTLEQFAVNTQNLSGISEARFDYVGSLSAPISAAVINFNENALPPFPRRFAMDNLTFQPIPEPATISLFSVGLMGLAAGARRRRRARPDASPE